MAEEPATQPSSPSTDSSEQAQHEQQDDRAAMCAICRSELDNEGAANTAMVCGHVFHKECIEEYAKVKNTALEHLRCPECRKSAADLGQAPAAPAVVGAETNLFWRASPASGPLLVPSPEEQRELERTLSGEAQPSFHPEHERAVEMALSPEEIAANEEMVRELFAPETGGDAVEVSSTIDLTAEIRGDAAETMPEEPADEDEDEQPLAEENNYAHESAKLL